MRDLDALDPQTPKPGAWLHFDVSFGCTASMLAASLLDLGAPERAIRDAFASAGLLGLGVRVTRTTRGGMAGVQVAFVDGQGRALVEPEASVAARQRRLKTREGRKGPVPHRDHRPQKAAAIHLVAQDVPAGGDTQRDDDDASNPVVVGSVNRGESRPRRGAAEEGWVARAIDDEDTALKDLMHQLEASRLPPIPRALARKTMRRLVWAMSETSRIPEDTVALAGRAALNVLCEVVAVSALVAALDPGRMTSSALGISTGVLKEDGRLEAGPSSVILHCLQGVRVIERDLSQPCTSAAGACLIWAMAYRMGPRHQTVQLGVGHGLGPLEIPEMVHVCRAILSEVPDVASLEGTSSEGPCQSVRAVVRGLVNRKLLVEELVQAGAGGLTTREALDEDGAAVTEIWLSVGEDEAGVVQILHRHGAAETMVMRAERQSPGVREVTVAIGSAKKKQPITMIETWSHGTIVRAEPKREDLNAASRASGRPPDEIRQDAMTAWRRLQQRQDGPAGADGASEDG